MTLRPEFARMMAMGDAERLWRLYGLREPRDLVLEDLALARGVLVTDGPLDKMEARLVRKGNRGLIRVKQGIPETGRRRFAVSHELGHWELHKDVSQVFACTADDMVAAYKASRTEDEANAFASGLLMPKALYAEQSKASVLSVDVISTLGDYFGTSFTAAAVRYVDLDSEASAVVICTEGKMHWWRGSGSFRARFWLEAGSKLSPDTVAGRVFGGGQRPSGPEKVDVSAWTESRAGEEDEEDEDEGIFIEDCRLAERYGQVICLLRMP